MRELGKMAEPEAATGTASPVVEFSNDAFMEEVHKYPVVYDQNSREFKDKYKKLNAWTAIGAKFGMCPSEAEEKYGNIRSSYARYLRRRKKLPSGTGRADVPEPPEFRNLDWLITFIEHRDTISNVQHAGGEGSQIDEL